MSHNPTCTVKFAWGHTTCPVLASMKLPQIGCAQNVNRIYANKEDKELYYSLVTVYFNIQSSIYYIQYKQATLPVHMLKLAISTLP